MSGWWGWGLGVMTCDMQSNAQITVRRVLHMSSSYLAQSPCSTYEPPKRAFLLHLGDGDAMTCLTSKLSVVAHQGES
jgi:hypothetical protein